MSIQHVSDGMKEKIFQCESFLVYGKIDSPSGHAWKGIRRPGGTVYTIEGGMNGKWDCREPRGVEAWVSAHTMDGRLGS